MAKSGAPKKKPTNHNNYILDILSRPFGGLNETLALLELEYHLHSSRYDTIIVDTPPGQHFVDFLHSGERIHQFFNPSFMDVFHYFAQNDQKKSTNLLRLAVRTGLKKLISYLEYATGKNFIEDFVDAINTVYALKDCFLQASKLPAQITQGNLAKWFLVTCAEHNKLLEAQNLKQQVAPFSGQPMTLLVNRCATQNIEHWLPRCPKLQALKTSLISREQAALQLARMHFEHFIPFPDINSPQPQQHLLELAPIWSQTV